MSRQLKNPSTFPSDVDHRVVRFPTRAGALSAGPSRRPAAGPQVGVKRRVIRRVVVLEVARPLSEVTSELDREIKVALADEPRGVVCDLSGQIAGNEVVTNGDGQMAVIEAVAAAGLHVRDWPGTPVVVASPLPRVRQALHSHPLGCHLSTAESELTALLTVLSTSPLAVRRMRLSAHPSAPQDSRDFAAFVLHDWGLGQLVMSAGHVVGELVTRSTNSSSSDLDISISWNQGALRLCVRDHGPGLRSRPRPSKAGLRLPAHSAVAEISRAHGSLPTAEGGKARWAVLNAALPGPLASRIAQEGAAATKDLP